MSEEQEVVDNLILGVDPQPVEEEQVEDQFEEQVEEQAQEQPQAQPDDRVRQLEEKARIYDIIDNDPRLTQMIMDYMSRKNGVVDETPQSYQQQPQPQQQTQPSTDIAAMQRRLEAMENGQKQLLATITLQAFEMQNPDFKEYKTEVGQLLKKHPTYSLQEAYDHVKSAKVGLSPQRVSTPSAQAEGSSRVVVKEQGLGDLAALQRKLANRNAVKSDEEAFALAFKFAQNQAKRGE